MRTLLSLFILSMALQPLPLQACPMDAEPADTHHAAMQHADAHGCCETEADTDRHDCEEGMPCGSCLPGLTLAHALSGAGPEDGNGRYSVFDDDQHSAPPTHPPFRPPIS